jgi:glutamate-1-semialdehyde aminotransferase
VFTDEAFIRMEDLATKLAGEAMATIERHGMPWTLTRLGARVEYRFCSPAPRNGTESNAADDHGRRCGHAWPVVRGGRGGTGWLTPSCR